MPVISKKLQSHCNHHTKYQQKQYKDITFIIEDGDFFEGF